MSRLELVLTNIGCVILGLLFGFADVVRTYTWSDNTTTVSYHHVLLGWCSELEYDIMCVGGITILVLLVVFDIYALVCYFRKAKA